MFQKMREIPKRLLIAARNPIIRKNAATLMAGKMLGLLMVLGLMVMFMPAVTAHAQDAAPTALQTTQINAVNTVWTLVAAFLVFAMQVGFVMLEAGFARQRESVNILVEGIADTCICGITFWAWGYAFMFQPGTPFIGTHGFFLQGLDPAWGGTDGLYGPTGVPVLAFWVFQFAFADTCSTVTSGAMVGRTGFIGDLLYSVGVTGFIYPIVGHWSWGRDGWLAVMQPLGFRDFAGSPVVHTIGGAISLVGAIVLGPRLGRIFKRDGGGPMPPHDVILGAVGGLILWFGWYGFNPGSTLSAMDIQGIGRVSFNTTLAACSAGAVAILYTFFRTQKWDLGITVNGFLGGLVAIPCPCYWVDPVGAFFLGIGGGWVVIWGLDLLEYLRITDPLVPVPEHTVPAIWGTLSLGLLAAGKYGLPTATSADTSTVVTGLFYGGGTGQLIAQAIGSGATVLATFVAAYIIFMIIEKTIGLRLSAANEIEGLDLSEHGVTAYPEFEKMGNDGTPKTLEEAKALKAGKVPNAVGAPGD